LREIVITGTVSFGSDAIPFDKATAYISLLDVSMQDAPSKIISKQVITDIKYVAGKKIEFSIKGKIEDERGTYIISVHIDVDGDSKVSVGDYITTGYHQVASHGNTSGLNIKVERVTS
jgi:uncharacterized lipoprotein YbaY